jgi:hypothetical protein
VVSGVTGVVRTLLYEQLSEARGGGVAGNCWVHMDIFQCNLDAPAYIRIGLHRIATRSDKNHFLG